MDFKKLHTDLDEFNLRMDTLILLGGMLNDGSALPEPLENLLDDEDDETLQKCFPDLPADVLAYRDGADDEWRDAFMDWAYHNNKWGFAIKFARPVMRWNKEGNSANFSWGYYNTTWVYGDTLAKAVARGKAWARDREKAEKAAANEGEKT